MLNNQTFNDVDGYRVEIDRRQVLDAYVAHQDGRSTIEVLFMHGGEDRVASLGIGALGDIEAWLGRQLPRATLKGAEPAVESVIIGGKDYSNTDPHARAIISHLADQGITEQLVARMPYRVLVNMILRAQQELGAARSQ